MIAAWALRALAWAVRIGPALLSLLWRLKWQILVALFMVISWHFAGVAEQRGRALVDQAAAYKAAQAEATTLAREAVAHRESEWRMAAQVENTKHDAELATARSAADRYIATHSVRTKGAESEGGQSTATAPADTAGVREELPADGVVVSEQDVQACGEVTAYALALRDWAINVTGATEAPE